MPNKKILVSDEIKRRLRAQHAAVDNISLGDFSAEVIENGLDELVNVEPPGEIPRDIPSANGNKYVEFSLDRHKQLDKKVQQFKKDKKYSRDTTAYRACLFEGLGVDWQDW